MKNGSGEKMTREAKAAAMPAAAASEATVAGRRQL